MISLTCEIEKNNINELISKTERNRLTNIENKLMFTKGDSDGGGVCVCVVYEELTYTNYYV